MKSKITCLNPDCGKELDIPNWVNIDNYDGQILCQNCKARLAIKFKGSAKPIKYSLIEKPLGKSSMNIIVHDQETKELIEKVGERTKSPKKESA